MAGDENRVWDDSGMIRYARDPLLVAAVVMRAWYLIVLWTLSGSEFFGTWLPNDLRLAASGNAIALLVMLAGRLLGRDVVLWVGCGAALALNLLPGARVGLTAMELLPWVIATTAGVAGMTAIRLGRRYLAVSGVLLVAGSAWLALSVRLAAFDYYIALVAVWLALSIVAALPRAAGQGGWLPIHRPGK